MRKPDAPRGRRAYSYNRKILLSSLRSYVTVLIIPFALSLLFYGVYLSRTKTDATELNTQVLASASVQMDIHLDEVDSIAREISSGAAVRSFQWNTKGFEYPNAYRMIEVRDSLGNYTLTQGFIDDYFLLFNNSRVAISNRFIYSYDDFFNQYLHFSDDQSKRFRDQLEGHSLEAGLRPSVEMGLLNQSPARYLMLINPMMDLGDGYICMLINEESITSLFDIIDLAGTGCVFVADPSGEVVSRVSGERCAFDVLYRAVMARLEETPGQTSFTMSTTDGPMLVNQIRTANRGLTYVSVQPVRAILSRVNQLRDIMLLCYMAALLLGFVLCLRQARNATTPIASLMDAVGLESSDSAEALSTIQDIVTDLKTDNDSLQRVAGAHKLLLRSSFASRLLHGSFSGEAEALRIGQTIIPEYAHFTTAHVLLFHIAPRMEDGSEEVLLRLTGSMKVALRDILDRFLDTALTYDVDEETLALVVFNQTPEAIDALFEKLLAALPEALRSSLTVYGGDGCTPPLPHIARSFESARTTMAAHLLGGRTYHSGILWADTSASAPQYFFPPDMRYRLTESVTHGNHTDVTAILSELFQTNLVDRPLKPAIIRLFISDLLSAGVGCLPLLPKVPENDDVNERINAITTASVRNQPRMIQDFFRLLTDCAEPEAGDEATLIRQVTDYLGANYADSNLSLASISEHFSVNASVLSTTFKQQMGKNLSAYLEDIRIREAQRLLRTTDWTVNRIAEAVGYLSASTFCRAFRRNTGQNTSTFKAFSDRQEDGKGQPL